MDTCARPISARSLGPVTTNVPPAAPLRAADTLQCAECGAVDDCSERGWTLRLGEDDELYVFCRDCNEREMGRG